MIEVRNDVLEDANAKKRVLDSLINAMCSKEIFPYFSILKKEN